MILFQQEHILPILDGTKTQTRRIWKRPRAKVGSIHLAKTKMLSKEYFARLEILAVGQERLGDITDEDANAEGYRSALAYLFAFQKINKWPDGKMVEMCDLMVWKVVFRVIT